MYNVNKRRIENERQGVRASTKFNLSLAMDCPVLRPMMSSEPGEVIGAPETGGLYHHYNWRQRDAVFSEHVDSPISRVFGNRRHASGGVQQEWRREKWLCMS
jgi:hypothetical protein